LKINSHGCIDGNFPIILIWKFQINYKLLNLNNIKFSVIISKFSKVEKIYLIEDFNQVHEQNDKHHVDH